MIDEGVDDVLIAPSVLAADFMRLGEDIESISTADFVHYDVMDGCFVPNLSFGPAILSEVARVARQPVDCHLMIINPDHRALRYVKAGAGIVTFHWEAQRHAARLISEIHAAGCKAAIALNPATPPELLRDIIGELDMVLIMTVNPGFGGQSFIRQSLDKLSRLSKMCREAHAHPLIEVDGGITVQNAEDVVRAGANVLVAGSAVFGQPDREQAIHDLREAGRRGLLRSV